MRNNYYERGCIIKRFAVIAVCILVLISLAACGNAGWYSAQKYKEISANYVEDSAYFSSEDDSFVVYEAQGMLDGSIYYGYYYSANNEILVPDFYLSDNLGEKLEADGGTYFGKPNDGTYWCFIKQITDNWFYYELHWG